jgi:hypothetical protein
MGGICRDGVETLVLSDGEDDNLFRCYFFLVRKGDAGAHGWALDEVAASNIAFQTRVGVRDVIPDND